MPNPIRKLTMFFCSIMFVVLVSACSFLGIGSNSTPTQTLTDYCTALKKADYQTAYNQFVSGFPVNEAQYATIFKSYGTVSTCMPSNVNDSAGKGAASLTFANLGDVVYDFTLVSDNGTWKIKSFLARTTPSFILKLYCVALKGGDYTSAYSFLSSTVQSQVTQDQFVAAGTENGARKVSDCAVNTVDNTAGTGTLTITSSNGYVATTDYKLAQENNIWKISDFTSTATETLNGYCSALKSEDYQAAFTDFSSAAQGQIGSADKLASAFSSNKVTDCSVGNVDDTAGTGSISYTYADNSKQVFNYTLVNENNSWVINDEQQAQ